MTKINHFIFTLMVLAGLLVACGAGVEAPHTEMMSPVPIATNTLGAPYGGEPENDTITLAPPMAIQVALIAIGDNGVSGPAIGCKDSVMMVELPYTGDEPLTEALNSLLAIREPYFGESGLYNALHQSNLQLERVEIFRGFTEIYLSGDLLLGGVCDTPRVQAQLEYTARQFPDVATLIIFLNNDLLSEALSLK